MKNPKVDNYYTSRKSKLLKDFEKYSKKYALNVLQSRYGYEFTDKIVKEARQEYEILIPELPYIGGSKNPRTKNLIQSAWCLALYRALKSHNKTEIEAGDIIYKSVEAQINSYPKLLLRLYASLTWPLVKYRTRKLALTSQKRRYPEDWVYSFVPGDGKEFDFGRDYTECGITKFFHAQGADGLTPLLCKLEFLICDAQGIVLTRTGTISEGAGKCDFRYKRGRSTK